MKRLLFAPIILLIMVTVGCRRDNDPTSAPKRLLREALSKLEAHDYDGYLALADFDGELDSVQYLIIKQTLSQYQQRQELRKGSVSSIDIVKAKLTSDSLCTVFYQLSFPDSVMEVCSQKLVKIDGEWRLRLRN